MISISYLGLTREDQVGDGSASPVARLVRYFPWEDHRAGHPLCLPKMLMPRLRAWAKAAADGATRASAGSAPRSRSVLDDRDWNEELVLQRYELLYEAGAGGRGRARPRCGSAPSMPGRPMMADHRRILATGIARLRAKIKYRPVVFELMPPSFTLLQLQRSVEALAGRLRAQAEFPPPDRAAGTGRGDRRDRPPTPAAGRPSCSASATRFWPNARSPARNCRSRALDIRLCSEISICR